METFSMTLVNNMVKFFGVKNSSKCNIHKTPIVKLVNKKNSSFRCLECKDFENYFDKHKEFLNHLIEVHNAKIQKYYNNDDMWKVSYHTNK